MNNATITTDFLIIGSGAAGLNAALQASRYGQVYVLTKSSWQHSSSYRAQGGIATVFEGQDSFESHKNDTLAAGRNFCDSEAVDLLVKEGAREVKRYINLGMAFDRSDNGFDLGLEGGHSNRRVLHANGAATGKALIDFLAELVRAEPNINVIEQAFVYKLFCEENDCAGAAAYRYMKKELLAVQSPVTILATGGYAGLFERSTNPHTSTGDGLWLGYQAGTALQDLEFVQFHPTAFYTPTGRTFLISEALRGEGARLYNQKGERFMRDISRRELAPRDVVSREIFHQIQHQQNDYVYLDVRHIDADEVRSHFPNLCARIKKQGIDIEKEGIPVAPAAHYGIGGISTDLDGQTAIKGLYACGEVAATGVHGANRLASNSLLECLAFSKQAVNHAAKIDQKLNNIPTDKFWVDHEKVNDFLELKKQIASLLSEKAGIARVESGLEFALNKIQTFFEEWKNTDEEYFSRRACGLLKLAGMITESALQREESRGVHTRIDFPNPYSKPEHITFQKKVNQDQ